MENNKAEQIRFYSDRKYKVFYCSVGYSIALTLVLFVLYKLGVLTAYESILIFIGFFCVPLVSYVLIFDKEIKISSGRHKASFRGRK